MDASFHGTFWMLLIIAVVTVFFFFGLVHMSRKPVFFNCLSVKDFLFSISFCVFSSHTYLKLQKTPTPLLIVFDRRNAQGELTVT